MRHFGKLIWGLGEGAVGYSPSGHSNYYRVRHLFGKFWWMSKEVLF